MRTSLGSRLKTHTFTLPLIVTQSWNKRPTSLRIEHVHRIYAFNASIGSPGKIRKMCKVQSQSWCVVCLLLTHYCDSWQTDLSAKLFLSYILQLLMLMELRNRKIIMLKRLKSRNNNWTRNINMEQRYSLLSLTWFEYHSNDTTSIIAESWKHTRNAQQCWTNISQLSQVGLHQLYTWCDICLTKQI